MIYELLMAARNSLYDRNWLLRHRSRAFVISVGNLTTGGTGKTPLVIALARRLNQQGRKVGVLSRGYGRKSKGYARVENLGNESYRDYGDEPVEMALQLRTIPIVVCEDRYFGAEKMVDDLGVDTILLDDGFQHRRLLRDLDIVTVDTTQEVTVERVLPFGPSRESWSGLRRANVVVLTKCNLGQPDLWRERVRMYAPNALVLQSQILAQGLNNLNVASKASFDLKSLEGVPVGLMSALGNPEAFEKMMLESCRSDVKGHLRLRDHALLDETAISDFVHSLKAKEVRALVTTEKDAVKIRIPKDLDLPVLSVGIACDFMGDWSDFDALSVRTR